MPYRGVVFASGSAALIADRAELYFYVAAGECAFLERQPGGTWSEVVARQAKRHASRT